MDMVLVDVLLEYGLVPVKLVMTITNSSEYFYFQLTYI